MPIISVANQKGGVGKTTTAINLAAALAELGRRVLLVDLDPQGNATTSLGFSRCNISNSIYEVLLEDGRLDEAITATVQENLYLLPANENLPGAEIELADRDNRSNLLRAALSGARPLFDHIIIDCPPSLGLLTLNGLAASDSLIITMQAEFLALEGLSQLLKTIRLVKDRVNPRLEIAGVVLTMYDGRTRLTREVEESLKKFFAGNTRVFNTYIPRTVRLAEAPSHGLPINIYAPGSNGSESYKSLALEVIDATEISTWERAGRPDSAAESAGGGVFEPALSVGGDTCELGPGNPGVPDPPESRPAPQEHA
jgi:chromosome partitioning protein